MHDGTMDAAQLREAIHRLAGKITSANVLQRACNAQ